MEKMVRKILLFLISNRIYFACANFYIRRLLKTELRNANNIPDGPCILALNHQSYLDVIIIHLLRERHNRGVRFLAAETMAKSRLIAAYYELYNGILVHDKRPKSIVRAFETMHGQLQKDQIIGIFPEGLRSPDGALQRPKRGVAKLAVESGIPVVPVGLQGFYETWPIHRPYPLFSRCSFSFGEPIYFSHFFTDNTKETHLKIMDVLMHEISLLADASYTNTNSLLQKEEREEILRVCRKKAQD